MDNILGSSALNGCVIFGLGKNMALYKIERNKEPRRIIDELHVEKFWSVNLPLIWLSKSLSERKIYYLLDVVNEKIIKEISVEYGIFTGFSGNFIFNCDSSKSTLTINETDGLGEREKIIIPFPVARIIVDENGDGIVYNYTNVMKFENPFLFPSK